MEKRYLGDNIYAEMEGEELLITTEDGDRVSNAIFFGNRTVVLALLRFITDMKTKT